MSYATIDDLRSQLGAPVRSSHTPEYRAKMLHPIPAATEVQRETFILERCAGKRVVEFGASGPLHDAIAKVASAWTGFDRVVSAGVLAYDLDDVTQADLPSLDGAEVIVCGEVLEHLSNPGHLLARIRAQVKDIPLIVSVPNAFTDVALKHLAKGYENVNIDHVAWYSPRTLTTLLTRAGFTIRAFHWYGGSGPTAQGIVAVAE